MPNHIRNRITFDCPEKRAEQIREAVMYDPEPRHPDTTGPGTVDFNKLIRMPDCMLIEAGSETDRGIELYLTAVNPDADYSGLPKMERKEFSELTDRLNRMSRFRTFNSALTRDEAEKYTEYSSPDELIRAGRQAVNNFMVYGSTTWYEWSLENWGTKWNSYDSEKTEDGLVFSTAWSAPHPVIEEMSARFPEVLFRHEWADEDIGNNCGRREYLAGECVEDYEPRTVKDAVEFSTGVWGDTPEDYGLTLNASETDYIPVFSQKFELIEILGRPALFTDLRLGRKDIPRGMHLSHFRGDDETTGGFVQLAPGVLINHTGSVITKEPVDFGEKGYINLGAGDAPVFTGREYTFSEFMEDGFVPDFTVENTQEQSLSMSMT